MKPKPEVRIFLMADSATSAIANQDVPKGYYNIETMLNAVLFKGGKVKICGTCAKARGLKGLELVEGAEISSMPEIGQWIIESDKVLTF
ncbi:MAG: DsrE/DsrF/TusD sulfur relay family protein [Actinomycetota bacterium]